MITVISFTELKTLLETGILTRSDNTNFIENTELRTIIMDQVRKATGSTGSGFLTILSGVAGRVDDSILEQHSNEILLKLPRPAEPIYITLPDDLPCTHIDSDTFASLLSYDYSDSQIRELVSAMFESDSNMVEPFSYAFLATINKVSVKTVIYDSSLAAKVTELQRRAKGTKLLFTQTNLFKGV